MFYSALCECVRKDKVKIEVKECHAVRSCIHIILSHACTDEWNFTASIHACSAPWSSPQKIATAISHTYAKTCRAQKDYPQK